METATPDPLPEDGWVTADQQPATLCRWCLDGETGRGSTEPRPEPVERHLVTMHGVVVCPYCDMVDRW